MPRTPEERLLILKHAHKFKVGDIITACHPGYHRITDIQKQYIDPYDSYKGRYWTDWPACAGAEMDSILYYERIATDMFEPASRRKNSCPASYCELSHQVDIAAKLNTMTVNANKLLRLFP
jgi:hypothetical protein